MRDKAADTNKNGITVLMGENMVREIKMLRFELKSEQDRKEQGRIIRQRLYGRDQGPHTGGARGWFASRAERPVPSRIPMLPLVAR